MAETEAATTLDAASQHVDSIEEANFSAALVVLSYHYEEAPVMGPKTSPRVQSIISRTLEKTHNLKDVRETLSRNVEVWQWLTRVFAEAIPKLTSRSLGPLTTLNDPNAVTPQESTTLIIKNHAALKEDLQMLNKVMHITRNLLVTSKPEIPQDICAAVHFDQMVYQVVILCVNVCSKGCDGEVLDDASRVKLNEVTELYKKLLVTALQQAHNWTAKNERNKMSFWFDVLCDEEISYDEPVLPPIDFTGAGGVVQPAAHFRVDVCRTEVQHWLTRNSGMSAEARVILRDYQMNKAKKPPGPLGPIAPLAWNWMSDKELADQGHRVPVDDPEDKSKITPQWNPDEVDKFEQDRAYGRVSREIDMWWQAARDPNYASWIVPMPDVNFAQTRTEACVANLHARASSHYDDGMNDGYGPRRTDDELPPLLPVDDDDGASTTAQTGDGPEASGAHEPGQLVDEPEDDEEEEDDDDDESYGEGPMTGLLTEIPNILDPKQIEALHMMVKSCIFDAAGGALTRSGENLQKTRCRMFLALDCGKALLREMLVFIAVWEDMDEQSLIFQISTQIVEAIHHNALIPYAWNALRIPKDIISPAQAVLLRLVTVLLRARNGNGSYQANGSGTAHANGQGGNMATPPPDSDEELRIEDKGKEKATPEQTIESKELLRDVKLLHFLFSTFRSRIVPECAALLNCQAQARSDARFAADFPVDTWDMERAKDGLAQFLELLAVVCESVEMRRYLIEWEAVYDVLALLKGLEAGVEKKGLVTPAGAGSHDQSLAVANPAIAAAPHDPIAAAADAPIPPPPPPPTSMSPPMPEPAYKFPWAGIKGQILTIIASLLQPPAGKSTPGNPDVQMQIVKHNGIISLLNCCVYDDHNRWAKEKVQICLKWLIDGSEAANKFIKDLVAVTPPPANRSGQGPAAATQAKTRGKNGGASSGAVPATPGGTAADLAKYRLHLAGKSPAPSPAGAAQGPQSGTPAAKVGAEINANDKATSGKQTKTTTPKQAKAPTSATTTQALGIRQPSNQQQAKVGTAVSKATSDPPTLPPLPAAPTAGPGGAGNAQSNRTPEFLHDIIGLADRAARMALGQEGDDADEEDFMKFLDIFNNSLSQWEKAQGIGLKEYQEFLAGVVDPTDLVNKAGGLPPHAAATGAAIAGLAGLGSNPAARNSAVGAVGGTGLGSGVGMAALANMPTTAADAREALRGGLASVALSLADLAGVARARSAKIGHAAGAGTSVSGSASGSAAVGKAVQGAGSSANTKAGGKSGSGTGASSKKA